MLKLKDNQSETDPIGTESHQSKDANTSNNTETQDLSRLLTPPKSTNLIRRIGQIALPIIIIAAAFGIYNYMKATKPAPRTQAPQEIVVPVRSIPVAFINHRPELTLYGTTVAGRQVNLRALVAGKVEKTGPQLQSGGEVNAGDTLLQIDPFDYQVDVSEAEAQLAEAKAKLIETGASFEVEKGNLASAREQLRLAQTDLTRAATLGTRGTISERTIDDRRLVLLQRQQAVTQSENNLKVWSARKEQHQATISRLQTVLARAQKRLRETLLTAPFNAYVSDVEAQVGRMVSINDRVATLIDRDWIDVRFSLTDGQFGRIAGSETSILERKIKVRWNIGRKALSYDATIERIDARVASESGGIQVYARIMNPLQPAPIRPGVFVEVSLPDITYKNVAKVPSEAIYNDDNKDKTGSMHVYLVTQGQLRKRTVEVVGTSDADFLIKGNIKAGERILITRLARPGEGVRVRDLALKDA